MLATFDAARSVDRSAVANAEVVTKAVEATSYLSTIGFALASAFAAQAPSVFPGRIDDARTEFCSLAGLHLATSATVATYGDSNTRITPPSGRSNW